MKAKAFLLVTALSSLSMSGCNWNERTVNTEQYDISKIPVTANIEELRAYSQISDKCPMESYGGETLSPLVVTALGSVVKQIAAYGGEQIAIARNYLNGDVHLDAKTLIGENAFVRGTDSKLCVLVIYGAFSQQRLELEKETISSHQRPSDILEVLSEKYKIVKSDSTLKDDFSNYRLSGTPSLASESPLDHLTGNPTFMAEFAVSYASTDDNPKANKVYIFQPTFLLYPHALHKAVFDHAKRDLTIEISLADVTVSTPLHGFLSGNIYNKTGLASRFTIAEGKVDVPVNAITVSVIEGPDKVPTDKALNVLDDVIKAKTDQLNKQIQDKGK
jgi:hypothetical protein